MKVVISLVGGLFMFLGVAATGDAAEVDMQNGWTGPISGNIFNPCALGGEGEFVLITVFGHHIVFGAENDNSKLTLILGQSHARGVGLTTGDHYVVVRAENNDPFVLNLLNGAQADATVTSLHIIGSGPGNDLLFQGTFHQIRTANGDYVLDVENFRTECL